MKNYEITVNGKIYQVTVKELLDEVNKKRPSLTSITDKEKTSTKQLKTFSQEEVMITAPMPGRILAVKVEENQDVHAGETVCLLEAMKMENEIVAPVSGVVSKVNVQPSQAVEAGESLIVIDPT